MLARITHANRVKNPHFFSINTFRFVLRRFISAAPTHFLVDLLIDSLGFSREEAVTRSSKNPSRITRNCRWLKDFIHRVEKDLGIPRESRTFFNGIAAIVTFRPSTLAKKIDVYKNFGWSDEHIRTMTRKYPSCLSTSEAKICKQLTFLMNEVGYTSEYLAFHSRLLTHSLEKRVFPRYRVLEILNEKHLKKGVGLYTAVSMMPSTFMEAILLPYKDKIPIAYESFMKCVG
ncbi:uncharacterized protein LOC129904293 [Solanum dulcamara]|uniref:uncharacterized protein LOC129904293 n=1 Tax=Solanum dulcamara TaxID=45834 RepID=UPI0024858C8F|nr:uncharacterized protein LOC129904293 [Solanum dulcamara]